MCNIGALIKETIEMGGGSAKMIIRRKADEFPLRIVAIYLESDDLDLFLEDLEQLEATYGFGV